jgi:esterase/lipase
MKNLLILHGAIGSGEQFESLKNQLSTQYDVHTLNFSGHGGEPFESKFNIVQFADDVLSYLDSKKIESVDVFGYSMGGYVALYLAKNTPERISKIITLGTKFNWTSEIAQQEIKLLNAEKIEEKIPAFAELLKQRHAPNNWKEVLARTANMMLEMGQNNPLNINDYKTIKHQVKIGLADQDEMVTKEETKAVANAIPNALFYHLHNSKHPIEKVDLQQLTHEIIDFINS